MGFSVIQEHHDAILHAIRLRTQGDWKCLVIDETTEKVIKNTVKEDDILSSSVATIERIESRRDPNPDMDVIYILAPEPHIVDCLIADFERRRYRRSYIIWTNMADGAQKRRIHEFPGAASIIIPSQHQPREILNPDTLLIDFYPRESHLVVFRDPWSFPVLYHPACNSLVAKHMKALAQKIAGVCINMGECPKVRYYRPTNAFHEASVLCSHLARMVQEELDVYVQWHKGEFPPPSNRPPSTLVITDRSMDLMAPLLHEFTYQAMAHDLLPVKDGEKVTFRRMIDEGTELEQEVDSELSDIDKVWVETRHLHMKDTIDKLIGDFRKFVAENTSKQNDEALSLSALRDMLVRMPQFKELKLVYTLHIAMAQECMAAFQKQKLPDLASAEQTMSTGTDEDYRKPKNILETVVGLLDDEAITQGDRLRLIIIYILFRGGIIPEDIQRLLQHASLPPQDGETIANLELLGGKSSRALKEPPYLPPSLFPKDPKTYQPNEEYALSRYEPVLKSLLDELTKGTLDQTTFPFYKPPMDPNEDILAAQGGSLRAGRPNWAAAGRRPPENRQRLLVFMAGGATYSESRVCYEVGQQKGRDIVLITSHMLTPSLFLRQVSDLGRDRRQLDIPMDRPPPRAPAHVFERPPPPPGQQLPPGAGPRMAANPGRRPPPAGGLPGRPAVPPAPAAPPVASMSNLSLGSNGAPPAKDEKPHKEKKKRNFLGMKK